MCWKKQMRPWKTDSDTKAEVMLGDGATGISDLDVNKSQEGDWIYDLQGRRVYAPKKGNLYIVNGKKVLF